MNARCFDCENWEPIINTGRGWCLVFQKETPALHGSQCTAFKPMTKEQTIQSAMTRINVHGPDRIMVNDNYAVSPKRAATEYPSIRANVIFIRNDGWSLGAPNHLESAAKAQWAGCWIAVLRPPNTEPEIIEI